jgi:Mrp family chromosome partitioning ATPase
MPENISLSYLPTTKMNTATPVEQSPGVQTATVIPERPILTSLTQTEKVLPPAVDIPEAARYMPSLPSAKQPKELAEVLRTRCKQLSVSLFFQGETSVRSLGFTSAIAGEGKTFLARLTAEAMAEDSSAPVTLLECNWENPMLSAAYNLPPAPGLSEWLCGQCPLEATRRQVARNLTIIPAGNSTYNATQLLRILQQRGVHSVLTNPNEVLIIDLPATVTTAYGPFAARLADSLILVVRMGVTPESLVVEACHYLKDAHMRGIIFNQVASRIPSWLRRIL